MNDIRHSEVLAAIRRIIRATDMRSKKLVKLTGLTSAQILIMQIIESQGPQTSVRLSEQVMLSQATVTTVLDRLESRGVITRTRDTKDRRKVYIDLSDKGREALNKAPTLLQEHFIDQFDSLADWEQTMLISSLQRVADLMNAETLDASPILDVGALDRSELDNPNT